MELRETTFFGMQHAGTKMQQGVRPGMRAENASIVLKKKEAAEKTMQVKENNAGLKKKTTFAVSACFGTKYNFLRNIFDSKMTILF